MWPKSCYTVCMETMSFSQIVPKCLLVFTFKNTSNESAVTDKVAVNARLFCIKCGHYSIEAGGRQYNLEAGDIFYMPSGCNYSTVCSGRNVEILNILFDFTGHGSLDETLRGELFSLRPADRVAFGDMPVFNGCHSFGNLATAWEYIDCISTENRVRSRFYLPKINAQLGLLLITLGDANAPTAPVTRTDKMLAYIRENVYNGITCAAVAEHFSYHPNYVNKLVREATGMSLHRYILYSKCLAAARQLVETDDSVTRIAQDLDFYDSSHFCNVFLEFMDVVPSVYRKRI